MTEQNVSDESIATQADSTITKIESEVENVVSKLENHADRMGARIKRIETHFKKNIDELVLDLIEHVFGKAP